jgi:hypothetical protein
MQLNVFAVASIPPIVPVKLGSDVLREAAYASGVLN